MVVIALADGPPGGNDLEDRLSEIREAMGTNESGEEVVLAPYVNSDGDAEGDIVPNPYGCYGQTDNPHASRTSGYTDIIVEARTVCPNGPTMPILGVDVILMKGSYCVWGICAVWTAYGNMDMNQEENVAEVEGLSSGIPCENGMYMGESLHYMVDSVGNFYYGYTENKQEVTRCAS